MRARTLTLGPAHTGIAPKLPNFAKRLVTWMQVARERAQLAQLDPAILRDIGLTEGQAAREARRPFWDTTER